MRVAPRASRNAVLGAISDGSQAALKIALQAPAVEGRANAALIKFLGDLLHVPRSSIEIASGEHGRNKSIVVRRRKAEEIAALIEQALPRN
ncbi:MAG: DUF167 domain-containing protein [Acidobacteriaceae bacterium]